MKVLSLFDGMACGLRSDRWSMCDGGVICVKG